MGLINHSEPLSTSEVGLKIFAPGQDKGFGPGWWQQLRLKGGALVPVRGTNRDQCTPLAPVGGTNRDQRSLLPALWAAEKRPLVLVGGTNRDQRGHSSRFVPRTGTNALSI